MPLTTERDVGTKQLSGNYFPFMFHGLRRTALTEAVEYPRTDPEQGQVSMLMLFNDPLPGFWDRYAATAGDAAGCFRKLMPRLTESESEVSVFLPDCRVISVLSSLWMACPMISHSHTGRSEPVGVPV